MDKKSNNYFVPIYNEFIKYKRFVDKTTGEITYNSLSLTPDELYIYYFLYLHRNYNTDTAIFSIDSLSYFIQLYSKKDKLLREDKNKISIRIAIESLRDKGIIDFKNIDYNNSIPLDISFYALNGGYEKIYPYYFNITKIPKQFFILCVITALKRKISNEEFALRIGHSEKHVREILKVMSDDSNINRILNKYRGEYSKDENDNIRQEVNLYEVRDPEVEFIEDRKHNWYDWKAKLIYNDYVIYRTTEDVNLKKKAEQRINALDKKKFDFSNWENKYNQQEQKKSDLKIENNPSEDLFNDESTDWGTTHNIDPFAGVDSSQLVDIDKNDEVKIVGKGNSGLPEYFIWNGENYPVDNIIEILDYNLRKNNDFDLMDYVFVKENQDKLDKDLISRFMDKFIALKVEKQEQLNEDYDKWLEEKEKVRKRTA